MKKISCVIILVIGMSCFIISCKKKDKAKDCSISEANFVGNYKVQSVKYKETSSSAEVDGTSLVFDLCELDDITTFNANHTYTYTDAGTSCDPNGDDGGTWSLSGSSLTVDGTAEPVDNFSCTGFSISQSDVDKPGDKITVTFLKQ